VAPDSGGAGTGTGTSSGIVSLRRGVESVRGGERVDGGLRGRRKSPLWRSVGLCFSFAHFVPRV
jgi:hypothetical protein